MSKRLSGFFNIVMLIVAGIIDATGYALLLLPSRVIDGGIAGVSLLTSHMTNINASVFLVVINLPFFFIGFKKMGWKFIVNSLIVISVYSLMTYIYTGPLKMGSKVFDIIDNDLLLAALFGGLCSGLGSGISIKCGGAIDGIDVMAVMFAKKIGITVGQFVMIFNATMYVIGSIVLKDMKIGMYSILCYTVGVKAIDFVVNGFDKCKAVNIITDKGADLSEAISKHLGRGITLLGAKGYYSNESKTMMYCVVNRFEVIGLKKLIKSIDSRAFVTVNEISDIMGTEINREGGVFKKRQNSKDAILHGGTLNTSSDNIILSDVIVNDEDIKNSHTSTDVLENEITSDSEIQDK